MLGEDNNFKFVELEYYGERHYKEKSQMQQVESKVRHSRKDKTKEKKRSLQTSIEQTDSCHKYWTFMETIFMIRKEKKKNKFC